MEGIDSLMIYIHIGMPKTGTTSIQYYLNQNRTLLSREYKILYPNFSGTVWDMGNEMNHWDFFNDNRENFDLLLDRFTQCIEFSRLHHIEKIIISYEGLFVPWWCDCLKQLLNTLQVKYKIILYLRRQDLWVESAWKQWGHKLKQINTLDDYIKRQNLNWMAALKPWLKNFQPEDFIVHTFEKKSIGDNVVDHFMSIFDIHDLSDFTEPPLQDITTNIGFSPEVIQILELSRSLVNNVEDNTVLDFFAESLSDSFKKMDPHQNYGLLSPEQRLELVRKYEESNRKIARLFFGEYRTTLFLDDLPDPKEPWAAPSEFSLRQAIPVLIDILMHQNKMIKQLSYGFQNLINFQEVDLYVFQQALMKSKQITDLRIHEDALHFNSTGKDPSIIVSSNISDKKWYSIRFDISVPVNTVFRMFYKKSFFRSYDEKQSVSQTILAGRNSVTLHLPESGTKMESFRIDPGEAKGEYIIYKIEIK